MILRRARFALISTATLVAGWSIAFYLSSRWIAEAPPLVRPTPAAAPDAARESVVEGVVSDYEPAVGSHDAADAIGTHVMDKVWLVKLDQISVIEGECPEKTLVLLVHSPGMDLGVRRTGEKIRVRLTPLLGPLEIIVPPSGRDLPDLSRVKYDVSVTRPSPAP